MKKLLGRKNIVTLMELKLKIVTMILKHDDDDDLTFGLCDIIGYCAKIKKIKCPVGDKPTGFYFL